VTTPEVTCWWCGKRQSEVKKMIVAGGFVPKPEASICNECIELCAQVIAMEDADCREQLIAMLTELREPEPNSN